MFAQQYRSSQVQVIDTYIGLGFSYDEAYAKMMSDTHNVIDDEDFELTDADAIDYEETPVEQPSVQSFDAIRNETLELIKQLAMARGYNETEATTFATALDKVSRSEDKDAYEKAYRLFLRRLV